MTDDDKRNEARLNAAIAVMKPTLIAANEAAHDLESGNEEDAAFDRMMNLGMLTTIANRLCGPGLLVLNAVADLLHDLNHHDEEPTEEAAH